MCSENINGFTEYTSDDQVNIELKNWFSWNKNGSDNDELHQIIKDKDIQSLKDCMFGRLGFGTAGMRAKMGAGFNRINDLVIIQTTQGLVSYMKKQFPNLCQRGVVIGFDARHRSEKFAHLAATAFIRSGVKVYLFRSVVPTPLVSFSVIEFKCNAGIMVTASHNPKHDNGYKVYWENGAQILSPHDSCICEEVLHNLEPWSESWDTSILYTSPLCIDPMEDAWDQYQHHAVSKYCYHRSENEESDMKLTYTPLHGVGWFYASKMLSAFGFNERNIIPVVEQKNPDPEFPTVKFPNPEEGMHVFELSFITADRVGSRIVLANDPDADRFQCAEKNADGKWRIFTGNEMGSLLAHWVWIGWQKLNPGKAGNDVYMLNSTVSSKMMKTIAEAEGFNYEETLTGFKWMGNRTHTLRSQGKTVLLAWEESIGYMCGESLDKDGVLAAAIVAEMITQLYKAGLTLADKLEELYQKYGYHLNLISYFISEHPKNTKECFERMRSTNSRTKYPENVGSFKIQYVRDLTVGYDSSQPDNKPVLPVNSSQQMITFTLENGSLISIRASGTEPKVKYYIEVRTPPNASASDAQKQLEELCAATVNELIQPIQYQFLAKED